MGSFRKNIKGGFEYSLVHTTHILQKGIIVELQDLVGEHVLDAVDLSNEQVKEKWGDGFEDSQVIRFRLDGVCYIAIEDPSDGYRSSMREIAIADAEMKNCFQPVKVFCRHRTEGTYGDRDDVLEVIDFKNGKTVLEVGTRNTGDYYPSFVSCFRPENMHINDSSSPQPSPNAAANE
jgi:hypothetical protein